MYRSSEILQKPVFNHTRATSRQHDKSSFFSPFIQPKLSINQPNDVYEQEADAVAEKVMRMPAPDSESSFFQPKLLPVTPVQRKCTDCEQEEKDAAIRLKPIKNDTIQKKCVHCDDEEKLQLKENSNTTGGMTAPFIVNRVINSGGQSLDTSTKNFMESRFGYDFSHVQVHHDSLAQQSSSKINALAYTHGNHVVFGPGQYQPHTNSGKQLLAHELTHVLQQNGSMPGKIQNKIIQRKEDSLDELGLEGFGDNNSTAKCPPVPTKEGDNIPKPSCPVATHIGANEAGRFNFCEDSSTLSNAEQLNELSTILKNNPSPDRFLVHGYASIEGNTNYNFRLACHRANRIAGALANRMRQNSNQSKAQSDAEIRQRIETASQGPTVQFGDLKSNRIAIIYAQVPGGPLSAEPECEKAPKHIGDIKPEIDCDAPSPDINLEGSEGSPQRRHFHFCTDSDVLIDKDASDIKAFAHKQAATSTFVVHGFSSNEGDAAYNKRLSCHRALRIARELANAGVQASQIRQVSGIGETDKFFPGNTEEARSFNRVVVVLAEKGEINLLNETPGRARTPEQKEAILKLAKDRIAAGQYQLGADAYISFWTCGKTRTVREAVERLDVQLSESRAIEKEEGIGVNRVLLSANIFFSQNPIECMMGRLMDMAFHHSVIEDNQLSPDLQNPSNSEPRHKAGLFLGELAGLTSCIGIDAEPVTKDPRKKFPPPLCAEAPQPSRLLAPPTGAKDYQTPKFEAAFLDPQFNDGELSGFMEGDSRDTKIIVTKGSGNMADFAAIVSLSGDPKTFANYEIGFIQTVLEDFTLAEYISGRQALQQLPVPIKTAAGRNGTRVPDPWMSLTASSKANADGQATIKTGFNLDTETALLANFFVKSIDGADLLDTWQRHTTLSTWIVARRLGSPIDRFSVFFINGFTYELTQNFNNNLKRVHGLKIPGVVDSKQDDLKQDSKTPFGEKEMFSFSGNFRTAKTSDQMADSNFAQYRNPVAGGIDLKRQFKRIIEPVKTTNATGMDKNEYTEVVKEILDNLIIFDNEADMIKGQNGKNVPRLGFVFSPLTITVQIDRASGRMLPFDFSRPEGNTTVNVTSAALGERARIHLALALAVRIGKRDFLQQGRSVILKPSAIDGQGKTGSITVQLPPLFPEKDLSKDSSVLRDMAELWACSELMNDQLDPREFAIVYWMDRNQVLHRIPEDGILISEPANILTNSITTIIPCGPSHHDTGFALGHAHTHPVDDEDAPLPSPPDKEVIKNERCGQKFYIVSENFVFAYFPVKKSEQVGKRKSVLPSGVKCDPKRWRQVKKE